MTVTDERTDVVGTVRDYFDGWFDGDVERMRQALHPDLAKRAPERAGLNETSAAWMIDATSRGVGKRNDPDERRIEIVVDDIGEKIASVTVRGAIYLEYVHLIRTDDGWKIVNTLWEPAR
jgi:ketosteroid isomerase-like protein